MKYFFLFLSCCWALLSYSQNEFVDPGYFNCGILNATETFFLQHPEERAIAEQAAIELEDFTRQYEASPLRDNDLIIIPVVFHIVHNFGTENISDEQIYSAISVLNADFKAQNQGVNSVVSEFQSRVANVNFEFRLAQKDPEGNCTNGIVRIVHPGTSGAGENLKTISPSWGRDKYLNIWVCRSIGSGAAGYSMLPSSVNGPFGAMQDGIVISHSYVGSIGTSSSSTSHSLTHEVGHWANLHHTWGPGNDPGLPQNCQQDDGVLDTPNTIGWTTCNLNGESCGSLDNVENFMEYSYCSKMFTNGQKNRLRAAMNSSIAERNKLFTSQNLAATGVLDEPTVCVADFDVVNERVICEGGEIQFKNLSYNGATSFEWSFDGGIPSSSTAASPIITYNQAGWYAVTLTASNGISGKTTTKTDFIHVLPQGQYNTPFVEGFENSSSFNSQSQQWTVINPEGTNSDVEWKINNSVGYESSKSAFVKGFSNSIGQREILMSPTIDLSGVSQNAVLKFKYAHAKKVPASNDKLIVFISRNCGQNWNQRLLLDGANLPTVSGYVSNEFVPTSASQWKEAEITNITSLFWTNSFRVKFEFVSESGNNIYIDDINIFDPATVGLEKNEIFSMVDVFPNPVKDHFQLNYKLKKSSKININIFDVSGRLVKEIANEEKHPGDHHTHISDIDLAPGIYFIKLETGDAAVSRKIIIQ